MPVLKLLERASSALARAYVAIAALALFTLVPITGWLVYGRYILNQSPTWVEATSLVIILVLTFAVAASGTWTGAHLNIAFIRESMPRAVERTCRALSHALMVVFGTWMAAASVANALNTWSRPIPLLNIPEGVRHLPLIAGGAGIALFSTVLLLAMTVGADRDAPADPTLPVE